MFKSIQLYIKKQIYNSIYKVPQNTYVVLRTFIFSKKCNTKNKVPYVLQKTNERKNKMFLNQNSTCVLKAKLTGAVSTSELKISVTYRDNTDDYHQDAIVSTNGTTAVTLLDAPTGSVVNIVELIKIYNPDTEANTVQILADDEVIASCTVGTEQTVILSSEGFSGNGYIPADTDLSNLTTLGKAKSANLAMPSNSYIDLTLGASDSIYTAPANGYVVLYKSGTAANQWMYLANISSGGLRSQAYCIVNTAAPSIFVPVRKNDQVYYGYTMAGTTWLFRFIYAEGEV